MTTEGIDQEAGMQRHPNRVAQIAAHLPGFRHDGRRRLASAARCAPSTVSRTVRSKTVPSVRVAQGIHAALERELGRPLPIAEVFSLDGTYPTPSACELCGCKGCLEESFQAANPTRATVSNTYGADEVRKSIDQQPERRHP